MKGVIFIFRTLVIIILLFIIPLITSCGKEQLFSIHIIDVGQGDSILIKTPTEKNILIDGGDENSEKILKSYLNKEKVKNIDMMFATHPDSDHIGSLDYIIDNFKVDKLYMPETSSSNEAFTNLIDSCKRKNIDISYLYKGDSLDIDNQTILNVLSPSFIQSENNLNSLVFNVNYKNKTFLFTGDSEYSNEVEIINTYDLTDVDFLKIAHHGSSSSSDIAFLSEVTPDVAVISCGYKNQYGHPHKSTLDNLNKLNILTYRTDLLGDIVFYSDGDTIFTKKNYN
ncbi:MAG: ComEC/Rec2 family competence protein [Romboutsia sp.]|uniref:ComEC/Rec2 family competence protein n=1 Tax=Romboutsia sp. TaxID=1965302 RepID=UPI003F32BCD8